MASTVYFVRHGECQANIEEIHLPPDLDVLTERGKLQVACAAKQLEDVTFTKAYTSPFPRARDTAQGILAGSKGPVPELKQDPRLQERDMGIFENRSLTELWKAIFAETKKNGTKLLDFEVEEGETVKELEARMGSFWEFLFEDIRQSDEPQTILVVSHAVLIMRLFLKLKRWSEDAERGITINGWSMKSVAGQTKNTGYHILHIEAPKSSKETNVDFVKINEAPHLVELNKGYEPRKPSEEFMKIVQDFQGLVAEQCAMQ